MSFNLKVLFLELLAIPSASRLPIIFSGEPELQHVSALLLNVLSTAQQANVFFLLFLVHISIARL